MLSAQKVERQTAEYRLLLEMNMRLKEQVNRIICLMFASFFGVPALAFVLILLNAADKIDNGMRELFRVIIFQIEID